MLEMMNHPDSPPLSDRVRRFQRGFTLMEILVVIVLIAMLVIIGYPILWRSRVRANLLGEVQMLQQATAVARINAVKYSRRVAMKILDGNTIQEGGLVVAWMSYQHRVFLETQFGLLFASCFLGFLVLYAVLVAVAIWRSSNKYRGLKRLAVLAKIWAILMVLRTLEVVPALFLGA